MFCGTYGIRRIEDETTAYLRCEFCAKPRALKEEAFVEQLFSQVSELSESTVYQAILRKGEAQGRAEEAQRILLRLGRARFGPPDKSSRAALKAITDLQRLEQLSERLLNVENWQGLLEQPRMRRRARRRTREG